MLNVFQEIAGRFPGKPAVKIQGRQLSYSELDAKSSEVSQYLIAKGLAGKVIALNFKPSFELVICMLAILKSSGTYICLDTSYPDKRNDNILRKASVNFVISECVLTDKKYNCISYSDLFNGDKSVITSELSDGNVNNKPLCIIFTSGSTGEPKGVRLSQGNLVSFVESYSDINENDCMAQLSSIAFDAFQFELWSMLLKGGTLCLLPPKLMLKHDELSAAIKKNNITMAFVTTALVNNGVLEYFNNHQSFRRLYFGGEPLQVNAVSQAFERLNYELIHCYGPTEATFWNVTYKVTEIEEPFPLGTAISNSEIILLDETGNKIVDSHIVGEIYIGGEGVTLGYWLDEELTNKSFVNIEGRRYFKTSDMAFWNDRHLLVFSHRVGNTIKFNGFRINLNEIDNTIYSIDGLILAKTILYENELQKYIVSFYCNSSYDQESIWKKLKEQLPSYMLPSNLIKLDSFPLNANGKVDVKALTNMLDAQLKPGISKETEFEDVADIILDTWRRLLGNDSFGYDDKYFEVGGNSVLILKLQRALNKKFGVELKVKDLFANTTVNEQAELIKSIN